MIHVHWSVSFKYLTTIQRFRLILDLRKECCILLLKIHLNLSEKQLSTGHYAKRICNGSQLRLCGKLTPTHVYKMPSRQFFWFFWYFTMQNEIDSERVIIVQ